MSRSMKRYLAQLKNSDFLDWDYIAGAQQRACQDIEAIVASWTDEQRAEMFIVGGP